MEAGQSGDSTVLDGLELIFGNGYNMKKANQVIQTGWEPNHRSTAWRDVHNSRRLDGWYQGRYGGGFGGVLAALLMDTTVTAMTTRVTVEGDTNMSTVAAIPTQTLTGRAAVRRLPPQQQLSGLGTARINGNQQYSLFFKSCIVI